MDRLWIKICGMTTPEALEAAAAAGADAVGFVFHAASPRNVEPQAARALARSLPDTLERVAVFLRPAQSLVDAALAAIEPDWVQVDTGDVTRLRLPEGMGVLHVLRTGAARPSPLPRRCLVEGAESGAGERADWALAAQVARSTELVLAGGLDAQNVAEAVRIVRPFGVDVSSGVESRRGVKDVARIHDFIRAARGAERMQAD
jgi:phosphoribosylanthranilate isomerase